MLTWGPETHKNAFPGIWLEKLGLDHLLLDVEEVPRACVWVPPAGPHKLDVDMLHSTIKSSVTKVLNGIKRSGKSNTCLVRFNLPEKRGDPVAALREGGMAFASKLLGYANRLAELIPAIDAGFKAARKKEQRA